MGYWKLNVNWDLKIGNYLFSVSKPYLSLIIPVTEKNLLEAMLNLMNADRVLQGAMFDYEFLVVSPAASSVSGSIAKFTQAIGNAKCFKVTENKIGGLLYRGLMEAKGVLRAIAFKNNFSFLNQFSDYIQLFKENDAVIGPRWQFTHKAVPQVLSAIIHSPYQFQIIKEEVVPIICAGGGRWEGWEFFTKAHLSILLSDKNISKVDAEVIHNPGQLSDLQLFKDAATIRIHYLYIRARDIIWSLNKKFVSAYQSIISKY